MKPHNFDKHKLPARIFYIFSLTILLFGFIAVANVSAEASHSIGQNAIPHSMVQQSETPVVIYFFWGDGCPHCAAAKPVLEKMVQENPRLELRSFEVYKDTEGVQFFSALMSEIGSEPRYVPTFIIGDQIIEGYNDEIQLELESTIDACLANPCQDMGAELFARFTSQQPTQTALTPTSMPTEASTPSTNATAAPTPAPTEKRTIKIPLLGEVDLSEQSLFLSTLLIAFIDGFNPCSIWVLTMLLSITLHTGSRKKILIVGLVFISVTGLIYALFIAGLFTVFSVISFMGWIRVLVALVAVFFGLINIKDYFWYKEGISLTIDDKSKPGLYKRMRQVANAGDSLWGLIGGTIILAAGVSLIEFSCTAGFPVLWTNLLTSQNVTAGTFFALLLVYMLVYQLDELGIFLVAVFTFKSNKVEEKHGRILKLIGGTLMVTLAGVILINPALMNDLGASLVIFAIAFGAAILILIVHRFVLPRLGIHIGTEESLAKKSGRDKR